MFKTIFKNNTFFITAITISVLSGFIFSFLGIKTQKDILNISQGNIYTLAQISESPSMLQLSEISIPNSTLIPVSYSSLPNGMPILNSRPDAPAVIFIDFNHDATTFYSEDADSTTFNTTEAANITESWRQVAIYFAMFDLNVTTIKPDVYAIPTAWIAIGNNVPGAGSTVTGSFGSDRAGGSCPSWTARTRITAIVHELGHNFGLNQQSTYNTAGVKTAEYSSGYDALHGPLMGYDTKGRVHKWYIGRPSWSAAEIQKDIENLAYHLVEHTAPRGYTGDGYAADDYGNTNATATPLIVNGATQSISGIIEKYADIDVFSFTIASDGTYRVVTTPVVPSGLDPKFSIYNTAGTLIAVKDGDPLIQPLRLNNVKQVSISLTPGTYYVAVGSHGNYADLGQYTVSVASYSGTAYPSDSLTPPRGTAVSSLTVSPISTSQRILNWIPASWKTGYRIERSTTGTSGWTALATIDQHLPGYTDYTSYSGTYYYRVVTLDILGDAAISEVVGGVITTRPGAISNLTVTALTTTQLRLNWTDVSGETGFRIERSTTGTSGWTTVTTTAQNIITYTDNGLSASTRYYYRIVTLDASGDAATSTVADATTSPTQTLSVSLSSSPSSGTAPLKDISLTAVVTGTVTGNINYTFYCNRSDSGVNITTPNAGKYDNQAQQTKTANKVCSFDTEGTYTAKVIVERGGLQSESRTDITVSAPASYIITVTQGSNGSISPSGTVTVNTGLNKSFTVTPNTNYHISDVKVDGSSIGAVASYTFSNVTKDHTIGVTFAINTHTLTVTALNGSVSKNPNQASYDYGTAVTLTAVPNVGYSFINWTGGLTGSTNPAIITVDLNKTVTANFVINTHTITASAGSKGSISPSGKSTVNQGAEQKFTITPDKGYHIDDVLVDGESIGTGNTYTFTDINADHTISAIFIIDPPPPPTPTLSVSLSSSPSSGTAPLKDISLTAVVTGTVTGNINYTFYCNRSDSGVNITTPNAGKYDNQAQQTKTANKVCSFDTEGTYTAKVIVERGGLQSESRTDITISAPDLSPTPTPTPIITPTPTPIVPTNKCKDLSDKTKYKPITSILGLTYDKTKDISSIADFLIEKTNTAQIQFLESLNLIHTDKDGCYQSVDMDKAVTISSKKIKIDSSSYPELNKKARIKFYNITSSSPKIMKDGVVCSDCKIIGYDKTNHILTVEVNGF